MCLPTFSLNPMLRRILNSTAQFDSIIFPNIRDLHNVCVRIVPDNLLTFSLTFPKMKRGREERRRRGKKESFALGSSRSHGSMVSGASSHRSGVYSRAREYTSANFTAACMWIEAEIVRGNPLWVGEPWTKWLPLRFAGYESMRNLLAIDTFVHERVLFSPTLPDHFKGIVFLSRSIDLVSLLSFLDYDSNFFSAVGKG